jgi:hypothetical protein
MLCVPVVNSRSRLHQNDLARYYLKELAAEKIVRRLGLMVRSGSRLATARRSEGESIPVRGDRLGAARFERVVQGG